MSLTRLCRLAAGSLMACAATVHAGTAPIGPGIHLFDAAEADRTLAREFARATAPLKSVKWLSRYGTTSPAVADTLDGRDVLVFVGCKPHDCIAERYAILVDPANSKVLGGGFVQNRYDGPRLTQSRVTWLGAVEWEHATVLGRHLY